MARIDDQIAAASRHLEAGRVDDARALIETVLDLYPQNAAALLAMARVKMQAGDGEQALQLARNALALNADDPQAYLQLAEMQIISNDHASANDTIQLGLDIAPDHPGLNAQQINRMIEQGDLAKAMERIDAILPANADNIEILNILVNFYIRIGNHAEAIRIAEHLTARDPDQPAAFRLLAQCYSEAGETADAIPLLEKCLLDQPRDPILMHQLAGALLNEGKISEAARLTRRVLALYPGFLPIWLPHIRIMALEGKDDAALADLTARARSHPRPAEAVTVLATALRMCGRAAEALRCARSLKASLPTLPAAQAAIIRGLAIECSLLLGDNEDLPFWMPPNDAPASDNALAPLIVDASLGVLEALALLRTADKAETMPTKLFAKEAMLPALSHYTGLEVQPLHEAGAKSARSFRALTARFLNAGPALEGLTQRAPTIQADPERRALWRASLAHLPRPFVAIAWKRTRPGIILDDLRPIFSGFAGTIISTAWDATRPQLADWPEIIDAGAHFDASLADLPALLAEVDLVIGTDGLPLHFAGAMHRPGIVLTQPDMPWYWRASDGNSTLYPTVTVIETGGFDRPDQRIALLADAIYPHLERAARATEPA